ncbi:hypothetical protein [Brevibacterium sp.]|uniref:hypothetical protein n=1 Tax=Brevibacterium sp. TaxID=1701 RepID=UPI002811E808|nr:hypothetical protein [Brevibacterium sp.]
MTNPDSSLHGDVQVLDDDSAAGLLLNPEYRRHLVPFLGQERSIGQTAALLGERVERVAHRVHRLVDCGVLAEVRQERRKGRPVTIYRAAAEIRAPLASLPLSDITRLFDALDANGRESFLNALSQLAIRYGVLDWAVRLYRAEDGSQRFDVTSSLTESRDLQDDGAPAIVFNWIPIRLDGAAAKKLQRDMLALVAELPISESASTHLAGFFLTPLARETRS